MNFWIALLRGINVGGKNTLPMKELRGILEERGLRNVRTYIQSGNCVFQSDSKNAPSIAETIAGAIQDEFGFKPDVLVLSKAELNAAIYANPYPEGIEDPKSVHLYFLAGPVTDPDLTSLDAIKVATERFHLSDRVFYLHAPDGIGRSKLAAQAERKIGVRATARNLRSAMKIAELAD